ncbi:unnamed protein product [Closterium sp. Yama58-4]|nr:unnamed protein product [Closterium sp. Yama58-4]
MWPDYIPIPMHNRTLEEQGLDSNPMYSLFLYREGHAWGGSSSLEEAKRSLCGTVPVLFIPGNAGCYKQVRSLASVSHHIYHASHAQHKTGRGSPPCFVCGEEPHTEILTAAAESSGRAEAGGTRGVGTGTAAGRETGSGKGGGRSAAYPAAMAWFSVNLREHLTALHSALLLRQSAFVAAAVNEILSLYNSSCPSTPARPSSVLLVGHSMGGIIARLAHRRLTWGEGLKQEEKMECEGEVKECAWKEETQGEGGGGREQERGQCEWDRKKLVQTIITIATPHSLFPLPLQPSMLALYHSLSRHPSQHSPSSPLLLVSLAAGRSDWQVRSWAAAVPPSPNTTSLHLPISTSPQLCSYSPSSSPFPPSLTLLPTPSRSVHGQQQYPRPQIPPPCTSHSVHPLTCGCQQGTSRQCGATNPWLSLPTPFFHWSTRAHHNPSPPPTRAVQSSPATCLLHLSFPGPCCWGLLVPLPPPPSSSAFSLPVSPASQQVTGQVPQPSPLALLMFPLEIAEGAGAVSKATLHVNVITNTKDKPRPPHHFLSPNPARCHPAVAILTAGDSTAGTAASAASEASADSEAAAASETNRRSCTHNAGSFNILSTHTFHHSTILELDSPPPHLTRPSCHHCTSRQSLSAHRCSNPQFETTQSPPSHGGGFLSDGSDRAVHRGREDELSLLLLVRHAVKTPPTPPTSHVPSLRRPVPRPSLPNPLPPTNCPSHTRSSLHTPPTPHPPTPSPFPRPLPPLPPRFLPTFSTPFPIRHPLRQYVLHAFLLILLLLEFHKPPFHHCRVSKRAEIPSQSSQFLNLEVSQNSPPLLIARNHSLLRTPTPSLQVDPSCPSSLLISVDLPRSLTSLLLSSVPLVIGSALSLALCTSSYLFSLSLSHSSAPSLHTLPSLLSLIASSPPGPLSLAPFHAPSSPHSSSSLSYTPSLTPPTPHSPSLSLTPSNITPHTRIISRSPAPFCFLLLLLSPSPSLPLPPLSSPPLTSLPSTTLSHPHLIPSHT